MLLDLREIIELPGGKVPFDYNPDMSEAIGGSIAGFKESVRAVGSVANNAGMLTFSCELHAVCICVCARCLKEFDYPIQKTIKANVTEGGAGENPDGYFLQGDKINATEIIVTEFILDMDDKLLCREDCAGLCQKCGADLNSGKCDCPRETDPRLAVLGQLLDNT